MHDRASLRNSQECRYWDTSSYLGTSFGLDLLFSEKGSFLFRSVEASVYIKCSRRKDPTHE